MIELDGDALRYISLYESLTRARVVDCLPRGNRLIFIVDPTTLGKAIGKKGSNLRRMRALTGKHVDVYPAYTDEKRFVKYLFRRFSAEDVCVIERDGKRIAVVKIPGRNKHRAIGRGGRNLALLAEIVRRHTGLQDLKVK